jgi:hypothetical protein
VKFGLTKAFERGSKGQASSGRHDMDTGTAQGLAAGGAHRAVAHPPESRGLWLGVTGRLMSSLGRLWALCKKGKRETG